jgi:hypothetical protein
MRESDNMTNDIWGMLGKKKSTSVTIPTKKTNNSNNNTVQTAQTTAKTTATAKPVKVKPPKVKPHKVHHQAQVRQQALNLSDYNLGVNGTQFQNPVMKVNVAPLHKIYNSILI